MEQDLQARGAERHVLRALYFDTLARDLARAQVALRLRLEDGQWIQTLKMPGADALTRIELNHPRDEPLPDLALYEQRGLRKLFDALAQPLVLRYETWVERQKLILRSRGCVVELAHDQGLVRAAGHELPISEIEFELHSGEVAGLFSLGKAWTRRYGLVLDMRSKAERGDGLADAVPAAGGARQGDPHTLSTQALAALVKARKAAGPALHRAMDLRQAGRACLGECLDQIIRNAAFAAGVDTGHAGPDLHAEYVHQLRVGMRRLRSCWKLYAGWTEPPAARLEAGLRRSFLALGSTRDADIVRGEITPRMLRAGMPAGVALRGTRQQAPRAAADLAASPGFQVMLLDLLAGTVLSSIDAGAPGSGGSAGQSARGAGAALPAPEPRLPEPGAALARRLDKWLAQIAGPGQGFHELPEQAQHALRKKAKRLRYGLEFAAPFLAGRARRRVQAALARVQAELGELNDLYVAEHHYRAAAKARPQAWFAVGWLRAMQEQKTAAAQAAFQALADAGALEKNRP